MTPPRRYARAVMTVTAAIAMAASVAVAVAQEPPPGAIGPPGSARVPEPVQAVIPGPAEFIQPDLGLKLIIPPGAGLVEKPEGNHLAVVSRKGYQLTIQTAPTNPGASMIDMVARLEAGYLGEGKTWAHKLSERSRTIFDLPAYDGQYENATTRARVLIARGRLHDYVIIFLAPRNEFLTLVHEFEWFLGNMKPAAAEVPPPPVAEPKTAPPPPPPPPGPLPVLPDTSGPNRFDAPDLGYTVQYPPDWTFERMSQYTVRFSGPPGTSAYDAVVGIQNVRSPDVTAVRGVAMVRDNLVWQIRTASGNPDFIGEEPFVYAKGGIRLTGQQFLVDYDRDGTRYRQWTFLVPRFSEPLVYVVTFAAPIPVFEENRQVAEAIASSWTVLRPAR